MTRAKLFFARVHVTYKSRRVRMIPLSVASERCLRSVREIGVDRSHIHYEFFGVGELGEPEKVLPAAMLPARAQITFARSEVQTEWTNQSGTFLEAAEAAGLRPSYNCRSGKCGSCATRLISGRVHYSRQPVTPAKGEVLICCAVPVDEHVEIDL